MTEIEAKALALVNEVNVKRLTAANRALRLGLYGLIDSDDADTIATTLEAGGEIDWSDYPENTRDALQEKAA